MDEKNLPKSKSSEKKPSAKKKAAPKKSLQTKGSKKKDVKKKAEPTKKAAPAKKVAAKPTPKAKPKSIAKVKPKSTPKPKKAPAAKKGKVSVKELLMKKFDTGAAVAAPAKAKPAAKIPAAPPFVSGDDKEVKRIRALLLKQIDLAAAPAVKKAETVEKAAGPMADTFERPKYEPSPHIMTGGPSSTGKAIKYAIGGLALLILILVSASISNRAKFYLKNAEDAVQVERGKFAPSGTELVMTLDGMKMPGPIRDVYTEEGAYLVVSDYFLKKADAALNAPGGPDFAEIKRYLQQATLYAPTKESRDLSQSRLKGMNFLVLLHHADVALAKGTLPDLQAAKTYLDEAGSCVSMDYQRELLGKRRAVVDSMIKGLKAP